jgi:hypothetical protein
MKASVASVSATLMHGSSPRKILANGLLSSYFMAFLRVLFCPFLWRLYQRKRDFSPPHHDASPRRAQADGRGSLTVSDGAPRRRLRR